MPTNDERRQVAAKLREKHGERVGTFEPQCMSIQAMNRLDDILDCLPKRRDVLLDLADLIDPTPDYSETQVTNCCPCGARATCRPSNKCGFPTCECGEVFKDFELPNYCPNCGVKLVGK